MFEKDVQKYFSWTSTRQCFISSSSVMSQSALRHGPVFYGVKEGEIFNETELAQEVSYTSRDIALKSLQYTIL